MQREKQSNVFNICKNKTNKNMQEFKIWFFTFIAYFYEHLPKSVVGKTECKKWITGSSPVAQWVKDPVLLQLWCRLQLWWGFDPWPGIFHMLQVWSKKKKKKKEFQLWFRELSTWCSPCEDAGWIPGLTQCIKNLALPQATGRPQMWLTSGVAMAEM